MANLSKTKTLFGFTSPRTIEKIISEIKLLCDNYQGKKWSGSEDIQSAFFNDLYHSEFYEGDVLPTNAALAARDRITRAPKALGFVDLQPTIELTQAGKLLLEKTRIYETFTRQLLKFQLPSPYHSQSKTVEFSIRPYLELIRLVKDLKGLSKTEIALFFLQLVHYKAYDVIVEKILNFRTQSKNYSASKKRYVHECFADEITKIFHEEIKDKKLKTRESNDASLKKFIKTKQANMRDYADAFTRYIRATELITFEKRTFRLIISPQKIQEVDFLLKTTPRKPSVFKTLDEFKKYIFNPYSIKLFSDNRELLTEKLTTLGVGKIDELTDIEILKNRLEELEASIKKKNIEDKKRELKENKELPEIIAVFEQIRKKEIPDSPLFLEWNIWRSFVMLNHAKRIDGNFIMDIDGMPLNTAPGNRPDIEIEFENFALIGEVTLSSGATQFKMEGDSVPRHYGNALREFKKDVYCIFIAPNIHNGCLAHFFNLNRLNTKHYGGKTKIIPLKLEKFIEFLNVGISSKFSDSNKMKNWLENQWLLNQTIDDEELWNNEIEKSLTKWAS
ncbi:MAG: AlwI family type II restriction endonuclease [Sulfurimonas sp.]|uniref:AlwI family type II restriction endonuclease n=1 Tax=Sulfurimonas sp. TaxID=2022749 RepID=UPI00262D263F|nr:AlwI family type II restriction endonuclease [Sulfurimonas sp.]MDD2651542.1 AlwI family type II restriction endonuclease [Sulfurimonas sp.]MDD3451083.1 AlwI family type II restriction endonuclease [Sulfurimonas sp.]